MVRQLNCRLDLAKSSSKETPVYHSLAQFVCKLTEIWECVGTGDTHSETGGPARLPALVAGRWGDKKLKKCRVRKKNYFVLGLK
jgi:hypothetical protein